jgi:hypothetical protein
MGTEGRFAVIAASSVPIVFFSSARRFSGSPAPRFS